MRRYDDMTVHCLFLNFRESKNISLPDVVDGHAAEMNRIILTFEYKSLSVQYIVYQYIIYKI